jgi:hypothetical protein
VASLDSEREGLYGLEGEPRSSLVESPSEVGEVEPTTLIVTGAGGVGTLIMTGVRSVSEGWLMRGMMKSILPRVLI